MFTRIYFMFQHSQMNAKVKEIGFSSELVDKLE